jgi:hypothetical protein
MGKVEAVFVGRLVPAVRTLISVPAGVAGMPLLPFLLYSALGTASWSGLLAGAGYLLEGQYKAVAGYLNPASNAVVGLIALNTCTGSRPFGPRRTEKRRPSAASMPAWNQASSARQARRARARPPGRGSRRRRGRPGRPRRPARPRSGGSGLGGVAHAAGPQRRAQGGDVSTASSSFFWRRFSPGARRRAKAHGFRR